MKHRIEYAEGTYRERIPCEACGGRGSIQPALFGEREAPDGREAEPCEHCDGVGYTVLELDGPEAEEAAMHVGILTPSGAVAARVTRLVVEHKTTSADIAPGSPYWRRLTLDTQVSTYLGAEEACEGMLYDVIRKPGIKPFKATPEADRRYTKTGALYAAQRADDETPEAFAERLRADISADPNRYYARGIIVRLPHERAEAARDTWLTAGSIRESMRLGAWPRNPGACDAYGRTCDYWAVCAGETTIDDDARFRTAATPHEELPGLAHRLPLLSNSAMSAYRSCPRKYHYSYVLRRRPHETPHALTFGTLIHAGLEVWWSSVDLGATLAAVQGAPDPFDVVRAEELLRGYHARWADERINVLAVERAFVAPLVNPDTGAASRTFELAGKCDAIAEVTL